MIMKETLTFLSLSNPVIQYWRYQFVGTFISPLPARIPPYLTSATSHYCRSGKISVEKYLSNIAIGKISLMINPATFSVRIVTA